MKYFYLLICITLVIILTCASTKTISGIDDFNNLRNYGTEIILNPKKKIAISKFSNTTRFGKRRLGENITSVLTTELAKTNRFVLLERYRFDQILEEIKLSQSGLTQRSLNEMHVLGADFLIVGSVTHYSVTTTGSKNVFSKNKIQSAKVEIDVRIINVRTGEIILSETGGGAAKREYKKVLGMGQNGGYDESLELDAFRVAVIKLTEKIIKTIDRKPWICDVVKISGNKLYIDAGRKSNIKIGEKLLIFKKGNPIRDLSGRLLGYDEVLIGEGEISSYISDDAAILQPSTRGNYILPLICKMKENF